MILSQKDIDKAAAESKREMLWGKPANDIINGRDTACQYNPVRAIWEMVQNARDVSNNKCRIEFFRKKDVFVYRHDGLPFTNHTLDALILQTSSKVRNDAEQVGQYGTGFLTTHKLGREFLLSGSLQLISGVDCFCNFSDFIFDRTPDTKKEMAENLECQFKAKEKLLKNEALRSFTPEEWTTFTFKQPNEIEKDNAKICFEQAPNMVPYVMCLNKSIQSIRFIDEIECKDIVFENEGSKEVESSSLYTLIQTAIKVSGGAKMKIISLDSQEKIKTEKGSFLPKVTVIMPLNGNKVVDLGEYSARLFLFLPLIGTEKWGINFILNSPAFTCTSENRSGIRFVFDGQGDKSKVDMNQAVITLATNMIFAYLETQTAKWENVRLLAPVTFNVHSANDKLNAFYESLKKDWLKKMITLPLVDVNVDGSVERKAANQIYVIDVELSKHIEKNTSLLDPIYNIMCTMHTHHVPVRDSLTYWSSIFNQWYEGEICERIESIEDIVSFIEGNGLKAVTETDLYTLCQYFVQTAKEKFFDKNILLTEDNGLTNKVDGLASAAFNSTMFNCLKVLLPEKTSKFIKSSFAEMAHPAKFGMKEVKEALPDVLESMSNRLKTNTDITKDAWKRNISPICQNECGLLSEAEQKALMNYCRMIIPRNSDSFEARILLLIAQFHQHEFNFNDTIENTNNVLEWRGAMRLLINNALLGFTLLTEEKKEEKAEWVHSMVSTIYGYSDFRSLLKNFRCYKSQTGEYRYCDELTKDKDIPERMKDIYNIIASSQTKQMVEIRSTLFDKEFLDIAETESTKEVVVFGNDIMSLIVASNQYPNHVDNYEHKDLIMDIIEYFEDVDEGRTWRTAFETIYNDIPTLLTKLVLNADNREPMIRIMKVKDTERLKKTAEIIENDNLVSIWELGKKAWLQEQNSKADIKKKKELGEYVEYYLRKELEAELQGAKLKVEVEDEQGGQDIVVKINDDPVYYIEVKSRWISADSVMMSSLQLDRSVEEKSQYSLFAVDMVGYNDNKVREHIYPDTMEEFAGRIRVVSNIGELNREIQPSRRDPVVQVHIGGDYKSVVPQKVIERESCSYDDFIQNILKPHLKGILVSDNNESI